MTPCNLVKYPRALANAEICPKNKHLDMDIITDGKKILPPEAVEKLNQSAFELAGACPYLFDVVSYICTHHREKISLAKEPDAIHYQVKIPWEAFLDIALDGYKGDGNSSRLKKELLKTAKKPIVKVVPFNSKLSIMVPLIMAFIAYDEDENQPKQYKGLKNVSGKRIKGVVLQFYKPLWASLVEGGQASSWFLTPKALTAKIHHAVNEYKDLPEFKKLGALKYSPDFRRLFFYINMHDNKKSNKLYLDMIDMARSCSPSSIDTGRGYARIHNAKKFKEFTDQRLKVLNKMAQDGLIHGVGVIALSTNCRSGTNTIEIGVQRNWDDEIQPFKAGSSRRSKIKKEI